MTGKLALSHEVYEITTKAWLSEGPVFQKQGATHFLPSITFKTQVHFLQVLPKWTLRNSMHNHDDGTFDWKIELALSNWHP